MFGIQVEVGDQVDFPSQRHHASLPAESTRRRVLWAAALVAALALALLPRLGGARADDSLIASMGSFKPTNDRPGSAAPVTQDLRLFPASASRVLYVYDTDTGWLSAYSLDTLAARGVGYSAAPLGDSVVIAARTDEAGTLWMAIFDPRANTESINEFVSRPSGIALVATADITQDVQGGRVHGIYRAPNSPVLWLLSAPWTPAVNAPVSVVEVSIPKLESGAKPVNWSKPQPSCPGLMHGGDTRTTHMLYVPQQTALYFGCTSTQTARGGVARLPLSVAPDRQSTTSGTMTLYPLAGDSAGTDATADEGEYRLIFQTYSSVTGTVENVFDARTNSYVGEISVGDAQVIQEGVDSVNGRFYGLQTVKTTGLIATDSRPTPVQQGDNFSFLARYEGHQPSNVDIAVDSVSRRVFLQYDGAPDVPVVQDKAPIYTPSAKENPDSSTVDVEEAPGKTTATYGGSATGFGSRYRQIGGVQGLVVSQTGADVHEGDLDSGTRELRTSSVDRLTLANDESTARAINAIPDDKATPGDLQNTANAGNAVPVDAGQSSAPPLPVGWPYSPANCVDLGGSPGQDQSPSGAAVSCAAGAHSTSASAFSPGIGTDQVSMGSSTITSSSKLDPQKGVVTTVVSTANQVSVLGGLLYMGKVTSTATSYAHGRPGTAHATFDRTFEDVRLQGKSLCKENCGDITAMGNQINSVLSAQLRVSFPEADAGGLKGTKGGYEAFVERPSTDQIEEILFNEQPADRLDVPAMTVTIYQDNIKPARTVIDLAAVETESYYGISLLSDDFGGGTGGDGTDATGGGAGSTDNASPVFGLDPNSPASNHLAPLVTPPRGGGGGLLQQSGRLIWNGLHGVGSLLPIWAILLIPVYLSARRWLLLNRETLTSKGMQ
jgi:hypothetical protein